MKTISKIVLLSSLLYLIGCSENTTKETNKASSDIDIPKAEVVETEVDAPIEEETAPVIEIIEEPKIEATDAAGPRISTQEPKKAGVTLNPPHGEPGHDCAIQVGAPLNGQAANTANGNIKQSVPETTTPIQLNNAPQTPSSVKLNPPHGQPGHDCAVEVGAPLN